MSHKIARDRQRASPSSPTLAPGVKKSFSLDAILKASENPFSPNHCYGLDVPYRNNPRYNPRSHFQPIPKGDPRSRSALSSPRSPRRVWGNPLNGLPFGKSESMPEFALEAKFGLRGASSAPPTPVGPWQCQACGTTDQRKLQPGADSTWSCAGCGVQATGVEMKDLDRFHNCPKEQDSSNVNDGVPRSTAAQAEAVALSSEGQQSANERKNLKQAHAGGTRMPTKALKRSGMIGGQNKVDKQVAESAQLSMEDIAREELCNKQYFVKLDNIFERINGLHSHVRKHIRFEIIRIYTNSLTHKSACRMKDCMLCLGSNPNRKLIAYAVTEQTLQNLLDSSKLEDPPDDVDTIARLTGGNCTLQQLENQLQQVKQLKLKYGSPVNRMSASSAIAIISSWTEVDARKSCPEPAPAALRVSRSVAMHPPEYGKPAVTDPGDVTLKLRDQVAQTADITQTRGDVRNTALRYLAEPKTIEFITASRLHVWSVCVLACLLLTCSATKLERKDSPALLQLTSIILRQEDISETTFADTVTGLAAIMHDHKPPGSGDDIFD